jgi:uncharacterized protein YprB with RNaseH-like and TPR domain
MHPRDRHRRLEELNRAPLKPPQPRSPSEEDDQSALRRRVEQTWRPPEPRRPPRVGEPVRLEDLAAGEDVETDAGRFYMIRRMLSELLQPCEELLVDCDVVWRRAGWAIDPTAAHPDLSRFLEIDPAQVLYVDIETAGFCGCPLFLIGAMRYNGEDFTIEQCFARNYAEEAAVVAYFANELSQREALVTFNGKAFDLPFIVDRGVINNVPVPQNRHHFDLLHEARRRWRRLLPNCKLQTLERAISRRARAGDIPSAEIPQAYHDFVRTGDAGRMKAVLFHNALDLITMAEIVVFMLQGRDPWT